MTLAYRKLAMMEKDFIAREEEAKIQGYYSSPIDKDLQSRVSHLLDKVRTYTLI